MIDPTLESLGYLAQLAAVVESDPRDFKQLSREWSTAAGGRHLPLNRWLTELTTTADPQNPKRFIVRSNLPAEAAATAVALRKVIASAGALIHAKDNDRQEAAAMLGRDVRGLIAMHWGRSPKNETPSLASIFLNREQRRAALDKSANSVLHDLGVAALDFLPIGYVDKIHLHVRLFDAWRKFGCVPQGMVNEIEAKYFKAEPVGSSEEPGETSQPKMTRILYLPELAKAMKLQDTRPVKNFLRGSIRPASSGKGFRVDLNHPDAALYRGSIAEYEAANPIRKKKRARKALKTAHKRT